MMPPPQMGTYKKTRKDRAEEKLREVAAKIDKKEEEILKNNDYEAISILNAENEQVFQEFKEPDPITNEIGYDLTTLHTDLKNSGRLVNQLHKISLSTLGENEKYKFPWGDISARMANVTGQAIPLKSVNRDTWVNFAIRVNLLNSVTPPTGLSSTCMKPKKEVIVKKVKKAGAKVNEEARKRAERLAEAEAEEEAEVDDNYNQNDGQVSTKMLQDVKQAILDECKRQNTSRLEYLRVVIDPASFAHTVENMFHLSFLVRDGVIGIELDRFKIPWVVPDESIQPEVLGQPTNKKARTEHQKKGNQGIITITMDLWEEAITLLDLTTCILP